MESVQYEQISQALRECQDMIELAANGGIFDELQFAEILKRIVSVCEACAQ